MPLPWLPPQANIEPGPGGDPDDPVPVPEEAQEAVEAAEEMLNAAAALAWWTMADIYGRVPPWLAGTFTHSILEGLVNGPLSSGFKALFPNFTLWAEQSFDLKGNEVPRGSDGSIRPDVGLTMLITDLDGSVEELVVAIWDLKTGKATIALNWAMKVANAFGIPLDWIKILRP
ncbi:MULTISPECIES: hypothetical protein [unclassified Nocardia]|uniref:hypothetical protein n=1 Tax=unclassified Nocardia TaxID=2637762 RepID=UPI00278C1553|nr:MULTISPECIES: hypothetical protein [unclassified Nocardia]